MILGVHGGMKIYRGNAAAARSYVESDQSRADDYYLTEGSGLATRFVATPAGVRAEARMDGPAYEQWVAGYHVDTGAAKGRLRTDEQAVRFVEVTVNGPKTWSLAAAVHPQLAAAYDAAQDRAAEQIIGWLGGHATTRVGPRGRQVQVPVEEIEAAVIRHHTSRAGDPHRHLHLQINARVRAAGGWRGLHTVGVRDSLEAINGIGHAAVITDPIFRAALAVHGYTLDPDTGEVTELARYAGAFSARARQIEQHINRYEAEWRAEHPGEEPGPSLRRAWDRRAWADARPDKVVPSSGAELTQRWVQELTELGFTPPTTPAPLTTVRTGTLDRDALAATALTRLGARRSAWNTADARGEAERLIAAAGVVVDAAVRLELAEDLTARIIAASVPLLDRPDVPEHVRALTSPRVLAVERELVARMTAPGSRSVAPPRHLGGAVGGLDTEQRAAVALLAGHGPLTVVEGAAGAGKTATLAATRRVLATTGRRMLVVTPTRKAAQVATRQVGAGAQSVAWLLHQHGYRWNDDGHWARVAAEPVDAARVVRGTLWWSTRPGCSIRTPPARCSSSPTETRAPGLRWSVTGTSSPPSAGAGCSTSPPGTHPTRACAWKVSAGSPTPATPPCPCGCGVVRHLVRCSMSSSPAARSSSTASEVERTNVLAAKASMPGAPLVVADTREQVAAINGLVHQVRVVTGDATDGVVTEAGERIGVGDRIATRRNDPTLDVANRETWTVTGCTPDGDLAVTGPAGSRRLLAAYVRQWVELAYATTTYGAQGETVTSCHVLVGEHTGASSAYVAMTRGRDRNTAHLVAESIDDARRQWVDVFARDGADLGPTHAALRAAEDIDRYGPTAPARRRRTPSPVRRREHDVVNRPAAPAPSRGIGF